MTRQQPTSPPHDANCNNNNNNNTSGSSAATSSSNDFSAATTTTRRTTRSSSREVTPTTSTRTSSRRGQIDSPSGSDNSRSSKPTEPASLKSYCQNIVKDFRFTTDEWGEIDVELRDQTKSYSEPILHKYTPFSSRVYGEIGHVLVNDLIRIFDLKSDDSFLDIGSGIGNVCFQVAAMVGCKCTGIEIREDLHKIALDMHTTFLDVMRRRNYDNPPPITLYNYDALKQTDVHFSQFNKIYINNLAYTTEMQAELIDKFLRELRDGTIVITMQNLASSERFNPKSPRNKDDPLLRLVEYPWRHFKTEENAVRWTCNKVDIYVYVVKKTPASDAAGSNISNATTNTSHGKKNDNQAATTARTEIDTDGDGSDGGEDNEDEDSDNDSNDRVDVTEGASMLLGLLETKKKKSKKGTKAKAKQPANSSEQQTQAPQAPQSQPMRSTNSPTLAANKSSRLLPGIFPNGFQPKMVALPVQQKQPRSQSPQQQAQRTQPAPKNPSGRRAAPTPNNFAAPTAPVQQKATTPTTNLLPNTTPSAATIGSGNNAPQTFSFTLPSLPYPSFALPFFIPVPVIVPIPVLLPCYVDVCKSCGAQDSVNTNSNNNNDINKANSTTKDVEMTDAKTTTNSDTSPGDTGLVMDDLPEDLNSVQYGEPSSSTPALSPALSLPSSPAGRSYPAFAPIGSVGVSAALGQFTNPAVSISSTSTTITSPGEEPEQFAQPTEASATQEYNYDDYDNYNKGNQDDNEKDNESDEEEDDNGENADDIEKDCDKDSGSMEVFTQIVDTLTKVDGPDTSDGAKPAETKPKKQTKRTPAAMLKAPKNTTKAKAKAKQTVAAKTRAAALPPSVPVPGIIEDNMLIRRNRPPLPINWDVPVANKDGTGATSTSTSSTSGSDVLTPAPPALPAPSSYTPFTRPPKKIPISTPQGPILLPDGTTYTPSPVNPRIRAAFKAARKQTGFFPLDDTIMAIPFKYDLLAKYELSEEESNATAEEFSLITVLLHYETKALITNRKHPMLPSVILDSVRTSLVTVEGKNTKELHAEARIQFTVSSFSYGKNPFLVTVQILRNGIPLGQYESKPVFCMARKKEPDAPTAATIAAARALTQSSESATGKKRGGARKKGVSTKTNTPSPPPTLLEISETPAGTPIISTPPPPSTSPMTTIADPPTAPTVTTPAALAAAAEETAVAATAATTSSTSRPKANSTQPTVTPPPKAKSISMSNSNGSTSSSSEKKRKHDEEEGSEHDDSESDSDSNSDNDSDHDHDSDSDNDDTDAGESLGKNKGKKTTTTKTKNSTKGNGKKKSTQDKGKKGKKGSGGSSKRTTTSSKKAKKDNNTSFDNNTNTNNSTISSDNSYSNSDNNNATNNVNSNDTSSSSDINNATNISNNIYCNSSETIIETGTNQAQPQTQQQ